MGKSTAPAPAPAPTPVAAPTAVTNQQSYDQQKAADDAKYAAFQKSEAEAQAARDKAATDAAIAAENKRLVDIAEAKRQLDNKNMSALDEMFGTRQAQVDTSVKYIDELIARERAKANVSGTEYNLTPEQYTQRVNDQLATFRSATDDQKILDLHSQYSDYANTKGYDAKFKFTPGKVQAKGAATSIAGTVNNKPTILSEEDEESKLGLKTVLG